VASEGEIYEITDGNTNLKYIWWDKTSPTVFQTSDSKPTLNPLEDLLICYNNVGTAEFAFLSNLIQAGIIICQQLDVLSANMGILTAGEIQLGTGTPGVDFTGIWIYKSGATYRVSGWNNNVLQAYLDSDGRLKAGEGKVVIDSNGISIESALVVPQTEIKWIDSNDKSRAIIHASAVGGAEQATMLIALKNSAGVTVGGIELDQANVCVRLGTNFKTLEFVDSDTQIKKDASDNLSFKDANAGTKILSDLWFVRADKDSDGDYDPLTAAAWENSTKSGNGTINLNTVFGVPTSAKAVRLSLFGQDATVGTYLQLKAKSTAIFDQHVYRITVANQYRDEQPVISIAADGTIWYSFSAAFDSLYLRVLGWYV